MLPKLRRRKERKAAALPTSKPVLHVDSARSAAMQSGPLAHIVWPGSKNVFTGRPSNALNVLSRKWLRNQGHLQLMQLLPHSPFPISCTPIQELH